MSLGKEFDELQRLFAQKDLLSEARRGASNGFMGILLAKRKNMKIKVYQEKGHHLPHIHIDYGMQRHAASYSIASGTRLDGNLSKKYDSDVSSWLERNRDKVLEIWNMLEVGEPHDKLVATLAADA
jgi:hypothetical protein